MTLPREQPAEAAACAPDLADVALIVLSAKVPPERLALKKLTDGSDYHFNVDEPIDYSDTLTASRRQALNLDRSGTKWPLHPDQQGLLDATSAANAP